MGPWKLQGMWYCKGCYSRRIADINSISLGGDILTKKDEKITLTIIAGMIILVFILNVIMYINMGFAEYMATIVRITERIKIIC